MLAGGVVGVGVGGVDGGPCGVSVKVAEADDDPTVTETVTLPAPTAVRVGWSPLESVAIPGVLDEVMLQLVPVEAPVHAPACALSCSVWPTLRPAVWGMMARG